MGCVPRSELKMKIHDISMELKEGMIVYPGNPEFKKEVIAKIPKDSTNLSKITLGTHTGTHLDARKHVNNKGWSADKVKLNRLYGKAKVLDMTRVEFGKGIGEKELKSKVEDDDIILLKTKNSLIKSKKFRENHVYLTEKGAKFLADKKVKCVGIDYFGIQKFHEGKCAAHCILLEKDIPIIEGLNLNKIKPGNYTFICLPLKIKDADGAPARAILIE